MGYKQSHGCVNMAIIDARWVFDWAELGDWVYVWDPSGETPTDPDLFISAGP
jgi:lipoprotein-anchoring transpeptidase ErfK/SrfK